MESMLKILIGVAVVVNILCASATVYLSYMMLTPHNMSIVITDTSNGRALEPRQFCATARIESGRIYLTTQHPGACAEYQETHK